MSKGMVYLVGAGPGDPGLLTIKGRECIERADVVVYDRLVNPQLLFLARSDAKLIYAGKSPDGHILSQSEINSMLVKMARNGQVVVRLKGGDPFVFGRGGEEAEVLANNGISFEIVPGVTSAVAVPAYAGIPVTHRDFTSTVTIITGNEDPEKEDSKIVWEKVATGAGTLVFLMGMNNLKSIVCRLVENGRSSETPVALVRWGTWAEQQVLTGTLADIGKKAEEACFLNPSVIILGEVVSLRDKLKWLEKKPLYGKRVLVTRPRGQAESLSRAIKELGGEVLEFPTIKITEPLDYGPLDEAISHIEKYQWIIFTSQNGVKFFLKRFFARDKDIRDLKGIKLGAIGPKTREFLRGYGLKVDFMPLQYMAEAIATSLKDRINTGERILLPRADIARRFLREALIGLGAQVDEVVAYRTMPYVTEQKEVKQWLKEKRIHIITFTSSSTVRNFYSLIKEPEFFEHAYIACIGPLTAKTAKELGLKVDIIAREYTADGLVKAICDFLRGN